MFGLKKILTALLENNKLNVREMIRRNEMLDQQNILLRQQNGYLAMSAKMAKRQDDFQRMIYSAQSGMQVPDSSSDEVAFKEFQETQQEEMNAVNETYFSDISLGTNTDEG